MLYHRRRSLFIVQVCAFLFIFFRFFISADSDVEIERKQFKELISPGESVVLRNPFGDVRVRSASKADALEVFAVIQNLEPKTPPPVLSIQHKEKEVTINVESKESAGKRDRADLVIYIPDHVNTSIETTHGLIEVKGLKGDVSSKSERGEMFIRSVEGRVEAQSDSGSILVELIPDVTALPQNFQTKTGSIEIYLWEGMDAQVLLETSGEITTDYSIEIDYHAQQEPSKIGTAKIGNDKTRIIARSKQGKLSLLRLIKNLPQATK